MLLYSRLLCEKARAPQDVKDISWVEGQNRVYPQILFFIRLRFFSEFVKTVILLEDSLGGFRYSTGLYWY